MKAVLDFVKTTVVGGLLVILPIYVSVILLVKAAAAVFAMIGPLVAHLPGGAELARLLALLIVVVACFLTGLLVRTRLGQWGKEVLERRLLERIPGYSLVRSFSRRLVGQEEGASFAVALVEIEEALVPAFLVEEHPDGRYTVFVPSAPTPAAGAIYILPPARVHRVDVPITKAMRCITQWGHGTAELLRAMPRPAPPA